MSNTMAKQLATALGRPDDIRPQVQGHIRNELKKRTQIHRHPVEYDAPPDSSELKVKISGLRAAKPVVVPHSQQPVVLEGLEQFDPQDRGDPHRVLSAIAKLIPFRDQHRAITIETSGDSATVRIDTRFVDPKLLAAKGAAR